MKNLLILLAGLWLPPVAAFAADGPVMEIDVSGMVCKFCSAKVARELKGLPGVKAVTVDLKDGRAEIIMDEGERLDAVAVRKAVKDAGFKPGEIKMPEEALNDDQD